MPVLSTIDHIHIYAPDRLAAEQWYATVLGFERVKSLEVWFEEGGPLTIGQGIGHSIGHGGVHLALFESDTTRTSTTIAFSVDAKNYELWKIQLKQHAVSFTESDHDVSWSIYFSDPYGNPYEITTYEYDAIYTQVDSI